MLTDRPLRPEDAAWFAALHALPHVRSFVDLRDVAALRASLGEDGCEARAVIDGDNEPVGMWSVSIEEFGVAELRCVIVAEPGRGIGGFAVLSALAWAFDDAGIERVFLRVTAANKRARALYERFGLQLEGTLREGFRTQDGAIENLCMYGILRREFDALKNGPGEQDLRPA